MLNSLKCSANLILTVEWPSSIVTLSHSLVWNFDITLQTTSTSKALLTASALQIYSNSRSVQFKIKTKLTFP